jgi:hypothetical protein
MHGVDEKYTPNFNQETTGEATNQCSMAFFFLSLCSHTWKLAPTFGAQGWVSSVSWSGTVGRTPCTGDQLVARPLPVHEHRKTHTHTQALNIHALSGIRTHGPGFRASEDSARPRPLGYRDWLLWHIGRTILICIFNKQFGLDRIQWWALVKSIINLQLLWKQGIFWPAEWLPALKGSVSWSKLISWHTLQITKLTQNQISWQNQQDSHFISRR